MTQTVCVRGSIRPKYFTALVWGKRKKKNSHKHSASILFHAYPPALLPPSFVFVCRCHCRQNNFIAEMDKNCPLSPKATAATCSPPGERERKGRGETMSANNSVIASVGVARCIPPAVTPAIHTSGTPERHAVGSSSTDLCRAAHTLSIIFFSIVRGFQLL